MIAEESKRDARVVGAVRDEVSLTSIDAQIVILKRRMERWPRPDGEPERTASSELRYEKETRR